ncbi:hypothetical protein ABE28_009150 [Peribacillus muralis]|uniref:Uncharacterized protein n=1 Tax=Peribacillus muralis TaxID=264697 RepID=A0A1B3XMS9_9BACI|nr:hypothetical protein [Peribacillus muralis]AOH54517.1 hypothetical protein ABE28_009150 [Peribacillus muralis]
MKGKNFSSMKENIKRWRFSLNTLFFVLIMLICCIFSLSFELLVQILSEVISLLLISFCIYNFMKISNKVLDKLELKSIKKSVENKNQTLYGWTGNVNADFIFELLGDEKEKGNTLENLRYIKGEIELKVGSNKGDYILLKNYIESYDKNSIFSKFNTIVFGLLVAVLTSGLTLFIKSEKVKSFTNSFFFSPQPIKPLEYIQFIVDVGYIVMIGCAFLIFIINHLMREKRKLEGLKAIIETIIYEKDNNISSTSSLEDTE